MRALVIVFTICLYQISALVGTRYTLGVQGNFVSVWQAYRLNHHKPNTFLRTSMSPMITKAATRLHMKEGGDEVNLGAVAVDEDGRSLVQMSKFKEYFTSVVPRGREMDLETFRSYSTVQKLLDDADIFEEDLISLWASAVGDADGLNEDEGNCQCHSSVYQSA